MPKMTIKEAQYLIKYWKLIFEGSIKIKYCKDSFQESRRIAKSNKKTLELIEYLLEAAKVVEANRCAEIVNTWFLKTTDEESVRINYVRLIDSRNEIMNQILSDNQEQNE